MDTTDTDTDTISDTDISSDPKDDKDIEIIKNIIGYLNNTCNTKYKYQTSKTKALIRARLNEGFTEDDFKVVIDKKYSEWNGDKKMSKYLRPETLFGTKFESYLNQISTAKDGEKYDLMDWVKRG